MKKDKKDPRKGDFGLTVLLVFLILILVSVLGYGYFLVKGNELVEKPKEHVFSKMEIMDMPVTDPPEQNLTPEMKAAIDAETERELSVDYPEEETYSGEPTVQDTPAVVSQYDGDFQSAGVVYGEDGTRYTWYSQNILPGGGLDELNANGRHVDESGYIRDGDGYIAVASSDHDMGTVLDTPFGKAKVYDTGCSSGTVDVYTDF